MDENKDFLLSDIDDDCTNALTGEKCPLLEEGICKGGWTSGYGGVPIEPPCCSMEPDENLTAWVSSYYSSLRRYEAIEDARIKAEKIKKQKAEIAKKRRHLVESYCYSELSLVKSLKKKIKVEEAAISNAELRVSAFNAANEFFRYSERLTVKPEAYLHLENLRKELLEAEQSLKLKQKEARATDAYKQIRLTHA